MYVHSLFAVLVTLCCIVNAFKSTVRSTFQPLYSSSIDASYIYYPTTTEDLNELSDDDLLTSVFLRQIASINSHSQATETPNRLGDNNIQGNPLLKLASRNVVEAPTILEEGCPVEIVYKKNLKFGNYLGRKPQSKSILVKLTSGEVITIDVGQIVSSWDQIADEVIPRTPDDWAIVAEDALEVLGNMSPRKSDLQEFWKLSSQRGDTVAIDSLDLGIYIFQEKKFKLWMNPYMEAKESSVYALSAAQRYASALLLFYDDFHFKRKPSTFYENSNNNNNDVVKASPNSNNLDMYSLEDLLESDDSELESKVHFQSKGMDGGTAVIEGGYRLLAEGVVTHKEGDAFISHLTTVINAASTSPTAASASPSSEAASPFRAGCVSKQQRALEAYAVAPASLEPPAAVKHLLKRLNRPLNPIGAQSILADLSISISSGDRASNDATGRSSASTTRGRSSSVTPWSSAVMEAASKLTIEIEAQRRLLSESPPARVGKVGPGGRMDYRGNILDHPVICVDSRKASFFDDAFSLSPETGEIW